MATDSLTDLISGVLLIPMLFALWRTAARRREEKRRWLWLFALLAASCLAGFGSHCFLEPWDPLWFRLSWLGLYPLLYGTAAAFLLLALEIRSGSARRRARPVWALAALAALASVLLLFLLPEKNFDILLFTLLASGALLAGFCLLLPALRRREPGLAALFFMLLPLLIAALFQFMPRFSVRILAQFNHNALTHVFLMPAELLLFAAALRHLKAGSF